MGIEVKTTEDGEMVKVANGSETKATPEELKEMRRQFAGLVVENGRTVINVKYECNKKEEEFLKELQGLCRHQVVVCVRGARGKKTLWGRVKQKLQDAEELCVQCGTHVVHYGFSFFPIPHGLASNALLHREVSREKFELLRKTWMHESSVVMEVPFGLFR